MARPMARDSRSPPAAGHSPTASATTTAMTIATIAVSAMATVMATVTATRGHRDRDESWTEQRMRDQLDRQRDASEPAAAVDRWQREPYKDRWSGSIIDEDDDRRPAVRAGDRWASVRNDDNGRELRIGERRAGVYSDGHGTEVRIEDRWAAVRREAALTAPLGSDERLDAPRDFP